MKKISYLLIVVAAVLWGSIGLFSKIAGNRGFTPIDICFIRSLFSVIILGIFFSIKDRNIFKLKSIVDLKYFVGTGIISFSLYNWSYIAAIKETSMGVAAILLYTAPSIIMILSVFLFHEKITRIKILVIVITFIGCMMVTGIFEGENIISWKGFLYGILSGIGYGLYSIFGKYALQKYSSVTVVFYTFLMSTFLFCVIGKPIIIISKINESQSWIFIVSFALFSAAIPYILYTKGLSKIEASKASIIANIEPVVAAIIGICVFSEEINFLKILGIILVLGAVCMINMTDKLEN
ncbi:EamA family transporter [Fusobacterium simiae]|uniref:EamA family transporter n=1 Tax=Fusobacterium simiae TaxID=855 RepID=A0ABT4DGS4_FUSSI|nr:MULTISPECIES: EamA family transporter [Fusobacterium]MCY7007809.1 EamA family transporter [Fusobacterium simiae]MDC7955895.1 EamA family transporter [Fusobacterium simiae]